MQIPDRPTTARAAERLALELFVAGYEGQELPAAYRERLDAGMTGVILFARNLVKDGEGRIDVAALTAHTSDIHAASDRTVFCAVDQEGGPVARLRAPFTHLPDMRAIGDTGDVELCADAGRQTGDECLAAGFNVDFAPILDIDTNPDNPIIARRAFGADPDSVTTMAGAFLDGMQRTGVLGCGKHFPGHGDTDTDSHLALPTLPFDRDRLEQIEMAPFARLAPRLPMVMTAHILFPLLDAELPATLSPTILDELLRGYCGFDGVIVSDDLEMKGVAERFSFGESVRLGLAAGVDLFLVCRREDALDEAVQAAGKELLDATNAGKRARTAIGRVRALRAGLRRPQPSVASVTDAIDSERARRLRNRLGIGTV